MFGLFNGKKESTGVFIPVDNGFKEVTTINVKDHSLNDVSAHLGYETDRVHMYFGDYDSNFDIQNVFFDIATKRIAWIHVKRKVTKIDNSKLKHFLRNFDSEYEFSTYDQD